MNLTAIRDPAAIAVRHVVDSLTALTLFRGRGIDRFVDLGSGGGFPGIPLAAALPADRVLLVDSIGKKARFLATVIGAVGLGQVAAAEASRAEALAAGRDRGAWPALTARAVAPLAHLIEVGLPLLRAGGVLVAWKRGAAEDTTGLGGELAAARRALAAIDPSAELTVGPPVGGAVGRARTTAILDDIADHCLVLIERGRRPLDRIWPRDPAVRRRAPL